MEKWLLENAVEVGLLVFGAIVAFVKLREWTRDIAKAVSELGKKMSAHLENDMPHTMCQVERERLALNTERWAKTDLHLASLEQRVAFHHEDGERHVDKDFKVYVREQLDGIREMIMEYMRKNGTGR